MKNPDSEDDESDAGVVDLATRRPAPPGEPPLGLRRELQTSAVGHCRHQRTRINEAERRAWCKACGIELDIWAVVAAIADWYENGWTTADWVAGLRAEKFQLQTDVKALKAERADLRRQLKALGGRVRERKVATEPNVVRFRTGETE